MTDTKDSGVDASTLDSTETTVPLPGDDAPSASTKDDPPRKPAARSFLSGSRGGASSRSSGTKRTADKPPANKPPKTRKNNTQLKQSVTELYTSVGMMVVPFDQNCGMVVVNSADGCADALVKAAEENDALMRALQGLVATSAWGGVIAAHLPIIMAVMAHHVMPAPENAASFPGMMGGETAQ